MRERRVSLLLLAVIVTFMSGVNMAKNELNFIFNGMISSSEGTDETNPLFDNGTPMASWNTLKAEPYYLRPRGNFNYGLAYRSVQQGLVLEGADSTPFQQWTPIDFWVDAGSRWFKLKHVVSGLCIPNGDNRVGQALKLVACSSPNTYWMTLKVGSGPAYPIESKRSVYANDCTYIDPIKPCSAKWFELYLDVLKDSYCQGCAVGIWTWEGGASNQFWNFYDSKGNQVTNI